MENKISLKIKYSLFKGFRFLFIVTENHALNHLNYRTGLIYFSLVEIITSAIKKNKFSYEFNFKTLINRGY